MNDALASAVIDALRTVKDPEIPINLFDLGLIYKTDIDDAGAVRITMTLTTPNCPVAETMPAQVQRAVAAVDGVRSVEIDLVFEPAWSPECMTEDGRMQLEMMGIDWQKPLAGNPMTSLTIGRTKPGAQRPTRG